jgi:hypothetical protein
VIDLETEHTFLLAKTGDNLFSHPSPATSYRWALRGLRGIRLETVMIGGRRYTSREAVARFFARLSEPQAAATPGPSKQRAEQIAKAAKRAAATY